ncbi:MAG TPA: selenocysteine-specific translation elongation factor [Thermoanaerobaculia bacterium]|jgi:selenocysteine-specific elongation factor|nr:selenocysteine-specific translation elongation factor [Thermoanaerobaculia bacterium]
MRRVIVGTAGHIDHGKTSLVLALTGIDCDRWAEEKARGITIDLGFAHRTAGDLQIGFIDVPGHERFLHNALAGLGGVRVMLLVVAADEGVKPQTREHLAVCSLLGIPAGLVALTKSDLVAADLLELAQLEVEELLAGTPFAGSPILPVSSTTGAGVPELERTLLDLAARHAAPADTARPARLPIDRAFHLKGLGVVVTGTLASGAVHPGDTLELLPRGGRARVRSIQVHGQPREVADAGERTSLQLTGVTLEELGRGMQLGTPEAFTVTTSLLARFTLLADAPAPVRGFVPVRLHLYASEVMGRMRPLAAEGLAPGETGPVEIRLQGPVSAVRGDRYILRRPSPAATLGGGEILDPRWRRHRGTILAQGLTALQGDLRSALPFWVQEAGERGVEAAEIGRRLGLPASAVTGPLAELAKGQRLIAVPEEHGRARRWIAPSAVQRVTERARRVLKEYFQKDRLAESCPKAEAVRRILRGRAAELADVYLGWLEAQKVLTVQGDQVVLPGRSAQLTGEESKLSTAVLERFERAGLAPPSPGEVAQELKAKPQILEGVIRHLVTRGQLVKLPSGLILAAAALAGLRRDLLATSWDRFSVADFKDRFGLTRKWAIPLLEHLDSTGATRRLGDERMVVRPGGTP